jgi:hypothetical protein
MAILHYFIAKKAMPFGNLLSLNKRWQFGDTQLLRVRGRFCNNLSLNIDWRFRQLLIA